MANEERQRERSRSAPPPSTSAGIAPWIVVVLLVAFIGGMLLSPWFENQVRPRLPFGQDQTDYQQVVARLDAQENAIERLEGRVASLESRPSTPTLPAVAPEEDDQPPALNDPVAPQVVAELAGGRVARLETRVDALDRQQTQIGNRVDNLSAEVAGLTVRVQDTRGEAASRVQRAERLARDARAVVLIGRARSAFESGEPLGNIEPALRSALGANADDDIDRLANGMRTLVRPEALAARFDRLATALLDPSAATEEPQGWWDSFLSGLSNIFEVRRATEGEGERAEDIVDQIQAELAQRQVASAIALFQRLPADVQSRAARWLRDAQRYVQTENALNRLESRIVQSAETRAPARADDQVEAEATTQL